MAASRLCEFHGQKVEAGQETVLPGGMPALRAQDTIQLMNKEASISIHDLRFVGILCGKCGTETVLDFSNSHRPEDADSDRFTPPRCGTCRDPFDPAARRGIDKLREGYVLLVKMKDCPVALRRIREN